MKKLVIFLTILILMVGGLTFAGCGKSNDNISEADVIEANKALDQMGLQEALPTQVKQTTQENVTIKCGSMQRIEELKKELDVKANVILQNNIGSASGRDLIAHRCFNNGRPGIITSRISGKRVCY